MMSPIWFVSVFLLSVTVGGIKCINGASMAAPDQSTFRKDYRFYSAANGWLKVHIVPARWMEARLACHLEGARLASPLSDGLYTQMRALAPRSIHTGVHTMNTGDDYYSEEGVHLRDMPDIMWAEGEPNNKNNEERCLSMTSLGMADVKCNDTLAFICYKEKRGFMTMNKCGNFDKQYVRNSATGSCYKYYAIRVTWLRAHSICTADGGHLAVINSDQESKVLNYLPVKSFLGDLVFIGLYNWALNTSYADRYNYWSTVDGKSLEEAGFSRWRKGEPNSLGGKEYCGTFRSHELELELHNQSCDSQLSFICEIEVNDVSK